MGSPESDTTELVAAHAPASADSTASLVPTFARDMQVALDREQLWSHLKSKIADAHRSGALAIESVDAGPKLRLDSGVEDATWQLKLVDVRGEALAVAELTAKDLGPGRSQVAINVYARHEAQTERLMLATTSGLALGGVAGLLAPAAPFLIGAAFAAAMGFVAYFSLSAIGWGRGRTRLRTEHLYRRLYRGLSEVQDGHADQGPFRQQSRS